MTSARGHSQTRTPAARFSPFDLVRFRTALETRGQAGRDLARGHPDGTLGQTVLAFGSVDSTQQIARRLAPRGGSHGTIILAEEQTSGRGRRGRSWVSPAGAGIWATVILRPRLPAGTTPLLTLAGALAICEAAHAGGARGAEIKWPNDLVVGDRKFAGVLGEMVEDAGGSCVLLGLGIDLDLGLASLPLEVSASATSLRAEGLEIGLGREEVLAEALVRLGKCIAEMRTVASQDWLDRWRALSPSSHGRRVVVHEAGGDEGPRTPILTGTTRGIADDGSLMLEQEDGALRRVRFGGTLRFETGRPRRIRDEAGDAPTEPGSGPERETPHASRH